MADRENVIVEMAEALGGSNAAKHEKAAFDAFDSGQTTDAMKLDAEAARDIATTMVARGKAMLGGAAHVVESVFQKPARTPARAQTAMTSGVNAAQTK